MAVWNHGDRHDQDREGRPMFNGDYSTVDDRSKHNHVPRNPIESPFVYDARKQTTLIFRVPLLDIWVGFGGKPLLFSSHTVRAKRDKMGKLPPHPADELFVDLAIRSIAFKVTYQGSKKED
jgi:hypothetical protein